MIILVLIILYIHKANLSNMDNVILEKLKNALHNEDETYKFCLEYQLIVGVMYCDCKSENPMTIYVKNGKQKWQCQDCATTCSIYKGSFFKVSYPNKVVIYMCNIHKYETVRWKLSVHLHKCQHANPLSNVVSLHMVFFSRILKCPWEHGCRSSTICAVVHSCVRLENM